MRGEQIYLFASDHVELLLFLPFATQFITRLDRH